MTIPLITIGAVVIYAALMVILARRSAANASTQDSYHVASRDVGGVIGALSIASTWVWAPALFTSASQSFNNGWVGMLWFIVPNALALAIMIPFAMRIRAKYPKGFTLSGFMRRTYGKGTQRTYIGTLGGLAVLSVSVNLLAGGTVLSMLTGLPLIATSAAMLVLVLLYTVRYGVKASMSTDVVQILLIIVTLAVLSPLTIHTTGWDVVQAGLNGVNNVQSFFGADGRMVALTFGIISAIGLAAGPVGDQAFWQRAFAMRRGEVAFAFGWGAALFAVVPVLMSVLGFTAAGLGFTPSNPGYVNLELLQHIYPGWVTVPFMLMIVSALFSVVNSHLLAQATLASDITGSIKAQRIVLLAGAVFSLAVANVPGNSVTTMFLIYSTLRSSTFIITLVSLIGVRLNSKAVFWGINSAIVFGFGFAMYANLISGVWQHKLISILLTTLLPPLIAGLGTVVFKARQAGDSSYRSPAEVKAERESLLEVVS